MSTNERVDVEEMREHVEGARCVHEDDRLEQNSCCSIVDRYVPRLLAALKEARAERDALKEAWREHLEEYEVTFRDKVIALAFDYGNVIEAVADQSHVAALCDLDDEIRCAARRALHPEHREAGDE